MNTVRPLDRDRLGWWAIALALGALVVYLLYSFLGTFVFGIFVYYATRPIHRRLRRIIKQRSVSAAVSLVAIAIPVLLLAFYTIALAMQELNRLLESGELSLVPLESLLQPYFDISSVIFDPATIITQENAIEGIRTLLREAATYIGFFGTGALHLVVIVILAFYLLRDDNRLADWWRLRFSDTEGVMEAYMTRVDRDFSNIFFGNILNAILTGIIGSISYTALNYISPAAVSLPYPTLLGLLTGIASLIPVIGMKLIYVPVAIYLLVTTAGMPAVLWFTIAFVVVSFVVVDVIPDLVLRPYVSGRNLHLGMVMLAYIFGPLLFGWYGLFLGPMLLVLLVHFVALVLPELLAGAPIQPETVPDPLAPPEPEGENERDEPEETEESAG
ncbi:Htr-like protein [Halodesulfurarchaeum formicicum]|uniref:Htr-like protein n=1 Tax=Halodesulfurarchaeum formicicum TaxID=1873524 RepID=A0A1D8S3C7_9EURY|nr:MULTISPECIES: AI-2E family transporter [Halodesulfurarchaeum]AOW79866.1 Htr-like protein [Halodesulfurarchaeum formicicum]MDR5657554.1 AI-2E family transporter [Halodesulfurarchaeum sp. HSR-GB]